MYVYITELTGTINLILSPVYPARSAAEIAPRLNFTRFRWDDDHLMNENATSQFIRNTSLALLTSVDIDYLSRFVQFRHRIFDGT